MRDTIIEKDTICVTIGDDHVYNCTTVTIGRTGESDITQLEITIPEALWNFWAYLDFKKPNGVPVKTERLDIIDGKIEYDIPLSLLDVSGNLEVQLVLQNEDGQTWKSNTKKYVVLKSIDAVEAIAEKEDFITEAQKLLDEIRENGGSGGGSGAGGSGADGGYYTPSVTQPDANTMRVSYTPSKSGMSSVTSKDITLPIGPKGADGHSPVLEVREQTDGLLFVIDGDSDNATFFPFGRDGEGIESIVQTKTSDVSGGENEITVTTDKGTTYKFTVKNGKDGGAGKDGADGVGIESVKPTYTSMEDGGTTIITVTLTNGKTSTFPVKNGSKGSAGESGKDGNGIKSAVLNADYTLTLTFDDGTSYTTPSLRGATGATGGTGPAGSNGKDGVSATHSWNGTTLSITSASGTSSADLKGDKGDKGDTGATGPAGKTPVKGTDYFTEADKAELVASVIEALGGEPVFGYVDENNNIIIQGNLDDGTYSVKYEMEDGTTVDVGDLVLDSTVYYSVTNDLTNCTISNNAKTVAEGSSYSAKITANDGHELKSVVVTMGGTPVTVSGGDINIANVTGNIVNTAVAEEAVVEPTYTNKIPLSTDASGKPYNNGQGWKTGYRISGSSGNESAQTGVEVTGFIPVKWNDTVYLKGIIDDGSHIIGFYNSSYATHKTGTFNQLLGGAVNGEVVSFKVNASVIAIDASTVAYMRVSATTIDNNSIITINEPIA